LLIEFSKRSAFSPSSLLKFDVFFLGFEVAFSQFSSFSLPFPLLSLSSKDSFTSREGTFCISDKNFR
jgi:hypothetical protein